MSKLGIYSNLGERRRKIKQPLKYDFQLELALQESKILAQRMNKINSKSATKGNKAVLKSVSNEPPPQLPSPPIQHLKQADFINGHQV